MDKPIISIVIPTIDSQGESIRKTRKSLKRQTFSSYETIVIEDKDRCGAPWARNQGAKKAKGDFLLFLDDDIDIDPTYLEKTLKALKDNPDKSYAYCHYYRKGVINTPQPARPFNRGVLRKINYISTMSLIRKKDFPGWDESIKRLQDWDLWLTMLESGKEGVLVDEYLFTAYYKGGGITNTDIKDLEVKRNIILAKHKILEKESEFEDILRVKKEEAQRKDAFIKHLEQDVEALKKQLGYGKVKAAPFVFLVEVRILASKVKRRIKGVYKCQIKKKNKLKNPY